MGSANLGSAASNPPPEDALTLAVRGGGLGPRGENAGARGFVPQVHLLSEPWFIFLVVLGGRDGNT